MRKLSFRLIVLVIALFVLPIDTSAKTFDIQVEDNKAYETLNGEWHFYHEQLLTADDVEQRLAAGENGQIVSIPDSFENQVGMTNTYRHVCYLRIDSIVISRQKFEHT